jgi:hypothetical protein
VGNPSNSLTIPRKCTKNTELLGVVCCADVQNPSTDQLGRRLLADPSLAALKVKDVHRLTPEPQKDATAKSKPKSKTKRRLGEGEEPDPAGGADHVVYTTGEGTSPKDQRCKFPFVLHGRAYNNCSTIVVPEYNIYDVGPDGWCPVEDENFPGEGAHGMEVISETTKWGGCKPPGELSAPCVLSSWTEYSTCSEVCGVGTQKRTRMVVDEGDSPELCGALEATQPCNVHSCGHVETIAGGMAAGSGKIGFGYKNNPYNAEWVKQATARAPDHAYNPWSIALVKRNDDADIVFATSQPRANAMAVNFVRRIDIYATDPEALPDIQECPNIKDYPEPNRLPFSAAECRVLDDKIIATIGGIERTSGDETDAAFPLASSLAAVEPGCVFATTTDNLVSKIDLTAKIECEPWMTDLDDWEVDANGETHSSNIASVALKPISGVEMPWHFEAFRTKKPLGFLSEPSAKNPGDGSERTMERNVLCFGSKTQKSSGDHCCFNASSATLTPPNPCPVPVTASCERLFNHATQDYENAKASLKTHLSVEV